MAGYMEDALLLVLLLGVVASVVVAVVGAVVVVAVVVLLETFLRSGFGELGADFLTGGATFNSLPPSHDFVFRCPLNMLANFLGLGGVCLVLLLRSGDLDDLEKTAAASAD